MMHPGKINCESWFCDMAKILVAVWMRLIENEKIKAL